MISALTGLSGCANPASRKEQAKKELEKKYGETFQVTSYNGGAFLEDYYTVEAYADAYPELPFLASVDVKTGNLSDSYVTKRLCNRLSERAMENLFELKDDIYVYTEADLWGTVLTNPEVSLEDYMKDAPKERFNIHVFINHQESSLADIARELNKTLDGISHLNGSLCLYLGSEEQIEKVREYTESHDELYQEFKELTDPLYVGTFDIVSGNVSVTEYALQEMAGDRI